jgi:hypothetical protein
MCSSHSVCSSVALLLALSVPAFPQDPSGVEKEAREAFAWFDGLGFPDLRKRAYVKVATGAWTQAAGKDPENTYIRAFLLEDAGRTFTVLTEDLEVSGFEKSEDAPGRMQAGYERLDLRAEARALAEKIGSRDEHHRPLFTDRLSFGPRLEEEARTFALGRACERNGFLAEALALYTAVGKVYEANRQVHGPRDPRVSSRGARRADGTRREDFRKTESLREALAAQIGHVVFWRAILDFQDLAKSRQDLLETLRPFPDRFPESEHAETATKLISVLERMVREDEARARQEKPVAKLSGKERIAALIYGLRDQGSQPGGDSIFSGSGRLSPEGNELDNSARELLDTGYEAFPQLIEALDDERLTRTVDSFRDHSFSHRVMTIADCAEVILERIAGRRFYRGFQANPSGFPPDREATKQAIRAWWRAFQEKGEKQMLIEGTAAGDETSRRQALILLEKHPEVAAEAIQRGVDAARAEWVKNELLEVLARIGGPGVRKRLRQSLGAGGTLGERVAAARGLLAEDRAGTLFTLIQEWTSLREQGRFAGPARLLEESAQENLMDLLATSDSPEAIRALGTDLRKVPMNFRRKIVEKLGGALRGSFFQMARDSRPAIEEVLVAALDDTEETQVVGGGQVHPRICDLAAEELAENWPGRYRFPVGGSYQLRDRLIVEMKNDWRKERGLELVPPPPAPRTWTAPEAEVARLLDAVETAAGGAAGEEAVRGLEECGFGALSALRQKAAALAKDHPGRAVLEALAHRLETAVGEMDFYPEVAPGAEELAARLEQLEGKPLSTAALVGVLAEFAADPVPGAAGLELYLTRPGPGFPLTVTARIVKERVPWRVLGDEVWKADLSYYAGGGGGGASGGGPLGAEDARSVGAYDKLKRSLDEILARGAGEAVIAQLRLVMIERMR